MQGLIRQRIQRLRKSLVRAWRFLIDQDYYQKQGHDFKESIRLARDTVYR